MPEVMTTALAETDRGAASDEALDYVLRFAEKAEVVAIGPGLSSEDERTRTFVHGLVEKRETPVVIDADGLNCLAPWPSEPPAPPRVCRPGVRSTSRATEREAALAPLACDGRTPYPVS